MRLPRGQQAPAPSDGARRQIAQIDPKHIVDVDPGPDACEVFDFLNERFLMRSQIRRVDPARRNPGQDAWANLWKLARQDAESPDLIGSARAAAGEDEGQVGVVGRNTYILAQT